MTDNNAFEHFVADHLADDSSGTAQAERIAALIYDDTGDVRQRPRWLAFIKEPPMRVSSQIAVGSPTVRVVAIMAATLLLTLMVAGAGLAGSRLLAADGPIIVDQSGDGDFTTINEAVAVAEDGDSILVRPGTYDESVAITKDITLAGDGSAEDVVISLADGPLLLSIVDAEADVSNLTLRGQASRVTVDGGAPVLHDLVFSLIGEPCSDLVACGFDKASEGVSLDLIDSSARVVGNAFIGKGRLSVLAGSIPHIEGNTLTAGMKIVLEEAGAEGFIGDNTIRGLDSFGIGLIASPGEYIIERNTIIDAPTSGIMFDTIGAQAIIRDNMISGSETAIWAELAAPTISRNELIGNGTAIFLENSDTAVVDGNIIRDGEAGIVASRSISPTITGNDIEVSGRAIDISASTGAVVTGNIVCGGETSIHVDADADAAVADNETCE